jgi:hypothetical protein
MKRCEMSLTRSALPRADGSRPSLVQAPMRRTPITCMLTWRCMAQVIVIASANDYFGSQAKLFAKRQIIERGGNREDK